MAVKLIARDSPGAYGPKNVDLFWVAGDGPVKQIAVAGLEGKPGIQDLVVPHDVPRLTGGQAHTINCPPTRTRYVGLRVNDSYEAGPVHYNFQLAGFRVAIRLTEEDKRWLAVSNKRGRGSFSASFSLTARLEKTPVPWYEPRQSSFQPDRLGEICLNTGRCPRLTPHNEPSAKLGALRRTFVVMVGWWIRPWRLEPRHGAPGASTKI
ncbi:MAG: hypothetical protein EA424_06425 [Planctomycetaceae bacterium]|nr:MAG: hypothetical protein EA424_06425 [Planctomycetaceae bacterium]